MPQLYLRRLSLSTRILHHIRANKMLYRFSIAMALCALLTGWLQFSWMSAFLLIFVIYLVSGGWRTVRVVCLTLPRDLKGLVILLKIIAFLRKIVRNNYTVPDLFAETVKKHGNKVAFMFEGKKWTFKEVESYSNKVANYFQSIGYKKGDVVALLLENRPELVFLWLGLSKIGVASALINYNLKKEPLHHCISIVNSKGLIYSTDLSVSDAVSHIQDNLKGVQLFEFGSGTTMDLGAESLQEKLKNCSDEQPIQDFIKSHDDVLFYIYTSGTTGYPKACLIRHLRFFNIFSGLTITPKIGSHDTLYNVLPLYHSSAGVGGVGAVLILGATMVVRRKFSASQFWNDCIQYNATCFQYVGELCRYLLAQPPKDVDKTHSLRLAIGNGLRSQIWKDFKYRFNIPLLMEFYGATESIAGVINFTEYPGAIGFIPVFVPAKFIAMGLFKMDEYNEDLLRGPDGLCVPCKPGEVGQMAGKIISKSTTRSFDGYVSQNATKKKIVRDVVNKGDQWFLSGDTLFWDELGYVYFHDRLGDTFRWRGENVSTTEVEGVFSKIPGLNSVIVVGVEIPGCEGRAGLAAIEDPDDIINISSLGKLISENLPSYSRPMFLRITSTVDTTGTFKFQKSRLRKEGFDITVIKDKMFYLDHKSGEYLVLTNDIIEKFKNVEMRM